MDSVVENVRPGREVGPLIQFEELVDESEAALDLSSKPDNTLPDMCTFSKVTSRRKVPVKKKNVPARDHELIELKAEYEDLQMQFEAQRIMFEVEVDCLKGIIVEGSMNFPELSTNCAGISNDFGDRSKYLKDPGTAHVITGLQDQIKELERENYLLQQNLDNAVKITKEHSLCTLQKNEEDINSDLISELLPEVAQISEEVQSLRTLVETSSSIIDDLFLSHASSLSLFSELRDAMCQYLMQLKETSNSYQTQKCYLESKIKELQEAKLVWEKKSADFCKQVDDLTTNIQESEKALADLSEEHNLEKSRLIDGIIFLEKEVSSLSNSSLSREKELLRKDLEKTRAKLKDSESKLKNVIQEKTRLEGEKANAEREIKKLSNQKAFLERDKSRRESVAVRRRDSVVDKRSRCDEDNFLQTLEECQKLEVVAFEMERTIASLEDELASVRQEKDDVATRNESLSFELEVLSEKLTKSDSELSALREEILGLRSELGNSEASHQILASKISQITEEKEELAMQMTHAFLELEEERAIWSAKEKASTASVQENMNKYNDKIISLSTQLSKVTNEMLSLGEEFKLLEQRLKDAEERADLEKNHGLEKLQEINQLKHDFDVFQQESNKSELILKEKAIELQSDLSRALDEVGSHQIKLLAVTKERDELQFRIMQNEKSSNLSNDFQGLRSKQQEEPCCSKADGESQQKEGSDDLAEAKLEEEEFTKRRLYLEAEMHKERAMYNMEKAKLRMRLRGTQTKLDAFRVRYIEAIDEQEIMDRSFKEASAKLKNRLASSAIEVLNLKKELASARAPH